MTKPDPRGGPSAHGAALGAALSRIEQAGRAVAEANGIAIPPKCRSCAFRLGSLPNQCAETTVEAMWAACGTQGFACHHGLDADGQPTLDCAGLAAVEHAPFNALKYELCNVNVPEYAEGADPVRQAYEAWLQTADPDNRLDDIQRAALYARKETADGV